MFSPCRNFCRNFYRERVTVVFHVPLHSALHPDGPASKAGSSQVYLERDFNPWLFYFPVRVTGCKAYATHGVRAARWHSLQRAVPCLGALRRNRQESPSWGCSPPQHQEEKQRELGRTIEKGRRLLQAY